MWISEQYQKPLYVTSDVTIGDGKTVISFRGTGTSMTTGETEEIDRDCVLDFEMHAEVLRSEEEPELTVSDWNPEEEGQQNQAETIYDPEAGVTVTLRDISNIHSVHNAVQNIDKLCQHRRDRQPAHQQLDVVLSKVVLPANHFSPPYCAGSSEQAPLP